MALGPDSALGPAPARGERARKREKCEIATLLLSTLLTPPRLVPTPGTLTERQQGAIEQVKRGKNAVLKWHFCKKCPLAREQTQLLPHAYAWGWAWCRRGSREKGPTAQKEARGTGTEASTRIVSNDAGGRDRCGPRPEAWP